MEEGREECSNFRKIVPFSDFLFILVISLRCWTDQGVP